MPGQPMSASYLYPDLRGDDTSTEWCFTSITVDVEGDPGSPTTSGIRFSRWQYSARPPQPGTAMRVNSDGSSHVYVNRRRDTLDGPEQLMEPTRESLNLNHSVRISVPIRLTAVTLRDLRLLSGDPLALRAASAELWIEALISLTYDRFDERNPLLLSLVDIYPKSGRTGVSINLPVSALCRGPLSGTAFCRRLTDLTVRVNAGLADALGGVVGGASALLRFAWAANANVNYVEASGRSQEQILFRWQFEIRESFLGRPEALDLLLIRSSNGNSIRGWFEFVTMPRGIPLPAGQSMAFRIEEGETVMRLLDRINTEMHDTLCEMPYEIWQGMMLLGSSEWAAPTITSALKESARTQFRALVEGCAVLHRALLEEVGEERVLERWQQAVLRLGADLGVTVHGVV